MAHFDGLFDKAKAEEAFKTRVKEIGFRAAYRDVLISPTFLLALDAIVEEAAKETEAEREAVQAADLEPLSELRISEIAELLDMSAAFVDTFCHEDWGDPDHRFWLHASTNREIANWILSCTR
jgi:hypothetical protein